MKNGYENWATYNEAELKRDFLEEHKTEFSKFCRKNYEIFKKAVEVLR